MGLSAGTVLVFPKDFSKLCYDGTEAIRTQLIHVSRSQGKNALLLMRAFEERAKTFMPDSQLAYMPLGSGPCRLVGPDIHLLSQARCRPSRMIEFVFAASPETIRREPQECLSPSLSRPSAGPGSLRAV